ncbi:hypothetical protein SAMN05892877_12149 [Rhizobium subbaraonis]|uniref:Uncharacterized protein n=1 Tax=Rhizobium subbaraonis TaxID=908946 RepID=A0A285UWI0_9HYPH|nr:hypothetical protein SAMN05892877_12149 [Rhizobium subbaraonis]
MKKFALSAAVLALSATTAAAIPSSFGLPHFVQIDDGWLGDVRSDRSVTGSIGRHACDQPHSELRCPESEGRALRNAMPRK